MSDWSTALVLKFGLHQNGLHQTGPGHVAQSVGHLTRKSEVLGSVTGSGHILSFLLLQIQEGQLSVTGKSMCTKYWLTA